MVGTFRQRRVVSALLLGALALGLAACGGVYPNSTFNPNTEFNAAIDALLRHAALLGHDRVRRRRSRPWSTRSSASAGARTARRPKQVHGNTMLEITWTAIPAVILIFIAIPTVRTIFKTQAKAAPDALQVQVIGHQWWWEFRYPAAGHHDRQRAVPAERPDGQLRAQDAGRAALLLDSAAGRQARPDLEQEQLSSGSRRTRSCRRSAFNGFCAEFCGPSHANMRFRVFTVTPAEFDAVGRAPEAAGGLPGGARRAAVAAPVPSGTGSVPALQTAAVQPSDPAAPAPMPGAGVGLPAGAAREGVRPHRRRRCRSRPACRSTSRCSARVTPSAAGRSTPAPRASAATRSRGNPMSAGRRRAEPDARRHALHDRRRPVPERHEAPRVLDQECAAPQAGQHHADDRQGAVRSGPQEHGHDGRSDRRRDRRHRRVPAGPQVTAQPSRTD